MEMAEGKPRKLRQVLTAHLRIECDLDLKVCINVIVYCYCSDVMTNSE